MTRSPPQGRGSHIEVSCIATTLLFVARHLFAFLIRPIGAGLSAVIKAPTATCLSAGGTHWTVVAAETNTPALSWDATAY
jgi:hypothetical protein